MLEKLFHLKENRTDVKTEVMAGLTTFMTMAYILAVNPSILSVSCEVAHMFTTFIAPSSTTSKTVMAIIAVTINFFCSVFIISQFPMYNLYYALL